MPLRSTGDVTLDALIARQLRYGQTRWMEVLLAALMVAVGVTLLMPGETFSLPTFRIVSQLLTEEHAGYMATMTGGVRLWALYINGRKRNTPVVRVLGCLIGFVFWLGWFLGFLAVHTPPVPLFLMSIVMAAGEAVAGSRATRDFYAYDSLGLRRRRRAQDGRVPS